jgi:hypothetical protein
MRKKAKNLDGMGRSTSPRGLPSFADWPKHSTRPPPEVAARIAALGYGPKAKVIHREVIHNPEEAPRTKAGNDFEKDRVER